MRERRPILALRVLAPVALAAVSGCFYVGGAVAVIVSAADGGGGGGGTIGIGSEVSAEITSLPRPDDAAPDTQEVQVRLTSQTGRDVPLRLSYKAPLDLAFQDAQLARVRLPGGGVLEGPFTETPPLPTDPQGVVVTLEWSWQQDLGPSAQAGVSLALALVDDAGVAQPAFLTEGRKVGNDPPVVTSVSVAGTSGQVVVTFRASDSTADDLRIDPFFRIGGGPPQVMTGVDPLDLQGLEVDAIEGELSFLWDTTAESALVDQAASVVALLIPRDESRVGVTAASDPVEIVNNIAAQLLGASGARSASGAAAITFTLQDAEGDPASLTAVFRLAGATTTMPATIVESLAARTASSSGTPHTVTWSYLDDLQQSNAPRRVELGLQVVGAAAPVFSAPFGIGNGAPTTTITSVFGADPFTGAVPIAFTLLDALADRADVSVRFSTDGGQSFTTATSALAGGLTGLLTDDPLDPGAAFAHTFVWSSALDLPNQGPIDVVLEIAADDGLPGGVGASDDVSLTIDNRQGQVGGPTGLSASVVSPSDGSPRGGALLTIVGTGFQDGATSATLDGAPVAGLVVVDLEGTILRGRAPARSLAAGGVPRAVDLVVTVGSETTTLAGAFTYRPTVTFVAIDTATTDESSVSTSIAVLLELGAATSLAAPLTVDVTERAGGTATSGLDYAPFAGTLTFPIGSVDGATAEAAVLVLQDAEPEGPETVLLGLASPSPGARLGAIPVTTLTITDDDAAPLTVSGAAMAPDAGEPPPPGLPASGSP